MKKFALAVIISSVLCGLAGAGSESYSGKEIKQAAPPPCPEWYGDNEFNVSLWGTYAFTGTEYAPNTDLFDLIESTTEGHTVFGTFDRYVGDDHAWGGGADIKFFFHRYFGIGIEGFALDARRNAFDIQIDPTIPVAILRRGTDERVIGSVLGTLTLRYPIPCSRFAPYVWAGVGGIFGGGQRDTLSVEEENVGGLSFLAAQTHHSGSTTEVLGQFGGGMEVRFTRHIGWINDFSWNVISKAQNNFGMVRTGLNFAF